MSGWCSDRSPTMAVLVQPLEGEEPFWAFGYGPMQGTGAYQVQESSEQCAVVESWRVLDELGVGEYFGQPPERTALRPGAQLRYLDDRDVGRLGAFQRYNGSTVSVRSQCGDTVHVPLHLLRVPTGLTPLAYPALASDAEILYRYSAGEVRIYDSAYLAVLSGRCPRSRLPRSEEASSQRQAQPPPASRPHRR